MAESEVDPLIGQVLSGRFEIVAPLGVGGMGRVYKAVQRPLMREVALKVLNPRYDGTRDPGFERRFFLEASMTAKLKHPNTITVHDYGRTDDGIYYIAMEYLEGDTLQKVLAEAGQLPWPRALYVAGQIARSLREAHKLGMVHRDLKPANVMLMTEGTGGDTVKVLDFGLVKSFTPEKPKEDDEVDRTGLTQAGVLLGSPLYMAPEQARGEADPRTDIYALGILMFQTMAGRPPFVSKESIDVIVKHIREKPPELRSMVPEVPLEVNALVMKCLEKEPAARFQSMDELLDAMRLATSGQGLSGAFADPRTASGIIPRTSTPGQPVVNAATPSFTSAESVRSLEVEMGDTGEHGKPKSKLPLIAVSAVVLVGAAIGGVLAWKAMKPAEVIAPVEPVKPLVTVVDPPRPAAVEVRFNIDSQPSGATVTRDGVPIGVTPFQLTLQRGGTTPVQVALAFTLEGYEPGSTIAQGLDGVVTVNQPLTRKADPGKTPGKPIKKPKNPAGYKDDPYWLDRAASASLPEVAEVLAAVAVAASALLPLLVLGLHQHHELTRRAPRRGGVGLRHRRAVGERSERTLAHHHHAPGQGLAAAVGEEIDQLHHLGHVEHEGLGAAGVPHLLRAGAVDALAGERRALADRLHHLLALGAGRGAPEREAADQAAQHHQAADDEQGDEAAAGATGGLLRRRRGNG